METPLPTEVGHRFRAAAEELVANPPAPLSDEQRAELDRQIRATQAQLVRLVSVLRFGWHPVATALATTVVDLGRQLAPPDPEPAPEPTQRRRNRNNTRRRKR